MISNGLMLFWMEKNQMLCQSTHCPLFLPFNVFKNSPLRPYLWSGGKWAKIMTVFKLNQIILCAIFPHSIHIAHHMIKLIHIFHKKYQILQGGIVLFAAEKDPNFLRNKICYFPVSWIFHLKGKVIWRRNKKFWLY